MSDQPNAIVLSETAYLAPAATLDVILRAYQAKKELIEKVLRKDVDYGTIPGTGDKPALKKPGAEKLANFFGLAPAFADVETVEDWTGEAHGGEQFFYYRQKCRLTRGDRLIAEADGSCNSWEKKYRYRNGERVCPSCGKPAIKRSKFPPRNKALGNAPGWYCFDKVGGCGAEFAADDPAVAGQQLGQVKNPDMAEQVNTVLKMAQKRALVAAVLIATGASDYFTQDIEDFIEGDYTTTTPQPAQPPAQAQEPVSADTLQMARDTKTAKGTPLGSLASAQLETLVATNNSTVTGEVRNAAKLILRHMAEQHDAEFAAVQEPAKKVDEQLI